MTNPLFICQIPFSRRCLSVNNANDIALWITMELRPAALFLSDELHRWYSRPLAGILIVVLFCRSALRLSQIAPICLIIERNRLGLFMTELSEKKTGRK